MKTKSNKYIDEFGIPVKKKTLSLKKLHGVHNPGRGACGVYSNEVSVSL